MNTTINFKVIGVDENKKIKYLISVPFKWHTNSKKKKELITSTMTTSLPNDILTFVWLPRENFIGE